MSVRELRDEDFPEDFTAPMRDVARLIVELLEKLPEEARDYVLAELLDHYAN